MNNSTPLGETSSDDVTTDRASRRWPPGILIALAALVAFVSSFSTWVREQALDTDTWVSRSDELLAQPEVQQALSTYLVNELYAQLDVSAEIENQLPPDFKGLAGPISAALRGPATAGADRLVTSPQFRAVWLRVNRTAHQTLVNILRGNTQAGISSANGTVTLELGELLRVVGAQLGLSDALINKLPPDAGSITVFQSRELARAQTTVQILDFLSWFLFVVMVALYVAAVYLAPGRRLTMLRNVGLSIIAVGVLVLIVRAIAVRLLVDALVADPQSLSWANATAYIETGIIREIAWSGIIYGLLIAIFGGLLGQRRWAVATRRFVAPSLNSSVQAVTVGTAVFLVVAWWWSPGRIFNQWVTALTFVALIIGAVVALRRTTLRECPDAAFDDVAGTVRDGLGSARQRIRTRSRVRRPEAGNLAGQLAMLRDLHASGALADKEYDRAKERVLTGERPGGEP
ncbi:MAG: SHOCT domain-containing protein [Acidimicrobiia bacterium]|nr:SHOCT domain-containing protein [Acidimicrobiia bacterium]MDH5290127.1 SHOCT domain-containing protein [Acidimicrobiia bacterium]